MVYCTLKRTRDILSLEEKELCFVRLLTQSMTERMLLGTAGCLVVERVNDRRAFVFSEALVVGRVVTIVKFSRDWKTPDGDNCEFMEIKIFAWPAILELNHMNSDY